MRTTEPLSRRWHILTVMAVAWLAGSAAAQADKNQKNDEALRQEVLKFNDITGQDAMLGQIVTLLEDKEHAKKVLAAASKMVTKKEQPFNIKTLWVQMTFTPVWTSRQSQGL